MKKYNNDDEIIFENRPLYNHGLIEILRKTLDINNKILTVIEDNKKILEEAKKNGRTES